MTPVTTRREARRPQRLRRKAGVAFRVAALYMTAILMSTLVTGQVPTSAFSDESVGGGANAVVADSFDRVVAQGWGTADSGGTYTHNNAAGMSVGGGYATVDLGAAGSQRSAVLPTSLRDGQGAIDVAFAQRPTQGSGVYSSLHLRDSASGSYRASLRYAVDGRVHLSVARVDAAGRVSPLSRETDLGAVAPHQWLHLRMEVSGTTNVTVRAKAWPRSGGEPGWQASGEDASAARVATAGGVRIVNYASSSGGSSTVFHDTLSVTPAAATPPIVAPTARPTPSPTPSPTTPPAPSPTPSPTTPPAPSPTPSPTTPPAPSPTPSPTTPPAPSPTPSPTTPPAPSPTPSPTPTPTPPPAPGDVGTSGALPVGQAQYAIPTNAIFVATNGSDANAGTQGSPFATVERAIAQASPGGTIVLRAGTYRQRFQVTKRVTIQNYPGEAVWFDGSEAVTGWQSQSGRWVKTGWHHQFDSSPTYTWGEPDNPDPDWGFVNPNFPMAAHPDQVWIDGVAQTQVGSLNQVSPGRFYVDYDTQRLYLGTNPTGRAVTASTLDRAMELRADGIVLRGVGVRKYAPSVPHMGTVTVERPGITVENVHLTDNATTGLSILAENVTANRLTVLRNGLLGVHGNHSDNLTMTHVIASTNNTERFNQAPVSGGVKITRARHVSMSNGLFENNHGPGFWLDESVYDGTLVNSIVRGNDGHGVSLEISALMLVANNLLQDNGRFGIKVNNTAHVSIWNNTFTGSTDRPLNIVQDNRRPVPGVPGRDPRRPFPDPTMPWVNGPVTIRNNVIAGTSSGNCIFCVEDYSGEFTAEQMQVNANGNVYQRSAANRPTWLVVWSRGSGNPAVYNTLATFRSATGQDARSVAYDGTAVVNADGTLTTIIRNQIQSVGVNIPSQVASRIGVPTNTRFLGAFLD